MPSMQELFSICNSRRCYNNPPSERAFFFVLFCSLWFQEKARNPTWMVGEKKNHDLKRKKKRQPCGGSGLKDPKKCYTSKRIRGHFLHTPGAPHRVWGSYSIGIWKHSNFRVRTVSECLLDAGLICSSIQNSSAGPECVNEAFCNHGDRSAPLWSPHRNEKQKKKRGEEEKDTREHSRLSPGERKHSHVMRESLPSLGGRTKARRGGAPPRTRTHTHT